MGEQKYFAVFGNPVLHSKSPFIFNSAFEEAKIPATYLRIRPLSVQDIPQLIKNLPLAGANITAPFKESVLNLLDELSPEAQITGAVNTIVNNNQLKGYNTDVTGILNSFQEANIQLENKQCLILGAGGAARATAYALKQAKAEVWITNRTISKAQILANQFDCKIINWNTFDVSKHFDMIISTLLPNVMPPFFPSLKFNVLLEASYQPSEISIWAQKMNKKIISGERWLLHQAIASFKLFTNQNAPIEIMSKGLKQQVSAHNSNICMFSFFQHNPVFPDCDLLIVAENNDEFQKIKNEEINKAD